MAFFYTAEQRANLRVPPETRPPLSKAAIGGHVKLSDWLGNVGTVHVKSRTQYVSRIP